MLRMVAIALLLCGSGLASARPHHRKAARKHHGAQRVVASRPTKAPKAAPVVAERDPAPPSSRPAMVEQAEDDEKPDRSYRH